MENVNSQFNTTTATEKFDQASELGKDIFSSVAVPENLTRYVKRISIANCTESVNISSVVKPSGCTFLDWLFRGQETCTVDSITTPRITGELLISGQIRDEDIQIDFSGPIGQIVFHFTPLGFYELLGIPGELTAGRLTKAAEMNDRIRPLATELSRIFSTPTNTDVAGLSLNAITEHLSECAREPLSAPDYLHKAIAVADRNQGGVRVSEMALSAGVSERQLGREFSRLVGISPKFYCRVLQINSALENMLRSDGQPMVDIAMQGDFTDQSHFNRAFRQFLSMNPREYLDSDEVMLSHFLANWQGPHRA